MGEDPEMTCGRTWLFFFRTCIMVHARNSNALDYAWMERTDDKYLCIRSIIPFLALPLSLCSNPALCGLVLSEKRDAACALPISGLGEKSHYNAGLGVVLSMTLTRSLDGFLV